MSAEPRPARGALLLAGLWLAYAVPQVRCHGLPGDSPSIFYAGDRTLFWIEHPTNTAALDFDSAVNPEGFHSAFYLFPEAADPKHYPVLPGLVAAVVAEVTGVFGVDPVDGHHLGLVLLHAVGLYWFTILAARVFGSRVAFFAGATLLCFPAAIGHAFNNPKDWPCVDFYACAMLSSLEALVWRRAGAMGSAGIFGGLSLSCKLNGAFALLSVAGLAAYIIVERSWARKRVDLSTVRDLLTIYVVAAVVFFGLWPYLWHGPPTGWPTHLGDYLQYYLDHGRGPRNTWTDYPLRPLLFGTPSIVLLCALEGLVVGSRQRGNERVAFWFMLAWIALPVVRVSAPHSNFYDANRHYLEYIPGLCLLAGLGEAWILEWIWTLSTNWPVEVRRGLRIGAVIVLLAGWILPATTYRPFEDVYLNSLIGGLGVAQSVALFDIPAPHDARARGTEGDYWWGNVGDGLPRLEALLAPGQTFAICGPTAQQFMIMWPGGARLPYHRPSNEDLVYVSPREVFCGLGLVRALEERRPILYRAERGGGLIYEILGPADGEQHPVVTRPSRYEPNRENWGRVSPGVIRPPPA